MALRLLIAVLVVANIGYWLWSLGASTEAADREPQRLGQQIRPELVELRPLPAAAPTPPASAAAADAPASGTPSATTP
jgi:hypothetical protein